MVENGTNKTNHSHGPSRLRLISRTACYCSVQHTYLSSCVLSRNLNIKVYNVSVYLLYFMVLKLGLTVTEEDVQNRLLNIIFGPKWEETAHWEFHELYSFTKCY